MQPTPDLPIHTVVQIDPEHDPIFGGAFLVVTEIKSWGVQGYCHPLREGGGVAYYRVKWEHIVPIGMAEWAIQRSEED